MRTIHEDWLSFKEVAVPKEASEQQIKDSERLFKAGGVAMFSKLVNDITKYEHNTARELMKLIHDEVELIIQTYGSGLEKSDGGGKYVN